VDDHTALGMLVEEESIDYFVIYGPDPASILARYAGLTGRAPVPPVWSFGLWLSRNSYTSWDVVHEVVDSADAHNLPFDVIHLDTAWFKEDWNCDLRFSAERFADPAAHMARLRGRGVRVSLWQYNFIPPCEDNQNYLEARERGYFVQAEDGGEFSYPDGTIGSWIDDQIIDFTKPDAVAWYARQIEELIRKGAAAIKVDFGEGVPDRAKYENLPGNRVHNLYSLIYTRAIAEATHRASGEWIVWARSGTAGSQRFPVHWGGDSQCSWAGLRGTLKATISIGLSGIPYFSHDIGGFIGRPSAELYIRWAQFGLLSSHSRTHGAGDQNSREPWSFGDDADAIFRDFARLRYSLLPYLLVCAHDAADRGLPVVRSMLLEFPDDDIAWTLEDQYMLGGSLLVAPVLAPMDREAARRYYLPPGTWYDYWTKERIESTGEWREEEVRLDRIPVLVRGGSVIPYTAARTRTGNTVLPIVRVEAYEASDRNGAACVTVREGDVALGWEYRDGVLGALDQTDSSDLVEEPELVVYRGADS
jgi:alpha-D-xyloside xylohydrolase